MVTRKIFWSEEDRKKGQKRLALNKKWYLLQKFCLLLENGWFNKLFAEDLLFRKVVYNQYYEYFNLASLKYVVNTSCHELWKKVS